MPRNFYAAEHFVIPMRWAPLPVELQIAGARLQSILEFWRDTPYMRGQQFRGVGVDCVRFCSAVWDELLQVPATPTDRLPHDAALNKPSVSRAFMHHLLETYAPVDPVEDGTAEPGDVLVTGVEGAGPGHVLIVGNRQNTIWQAGQRKVGEYGWSLNERFQVLMHHYRFGRRERWQIPTQF